MIGEVFAIGSSVSLAFGVIVNKKLTFGIAALPLQTIRCWFAAIFLLLVLLIMGRWDDLVHIPLITMGLMALSMLIGIAFGDTLYLKALSLTEASRIFPVVRGAQILSTGTIAALFLGEAVSFPLIWGAVLVLGGASLVSASQTGAGSESPPGLPKGKKWLLFAAATGICHTLSFSLMKIVFREIDPILGHSFRLPLAALFLSSISLGAGHAESLKIIRYGRNSIGLLIAAGILGYGLGVLFSLYAVYFSGITKAAVLTSWTPVFIMFLAALLLKERLTIQLGIGVLLCSAGTAMIVAF